MAKISQFCEQSTLEMVKDVCNNIHQEELLAIHSRDFLVPVNILRKKSMLYQVSLVIGVHNKVLIMKFTKTKWL